MTAATQPFIEHPRAIPIKDVYLVDDADGPPQCNVVSESGRWWRISLPVCALLHLMDGQRSLAEIAQQALTKHNLRIPRDKLQKLVTDELIPAGLVINPALVSSPSLPVDKEMIRLPFMPKRMVVAIATGLKTLYYPPLAFVLLFTGLALHGLFYARYPPSQLADQVARHYESIYLGVVLSALLHEFGHAAASAYYGVRPGAIGFGMYFFMPVLWSDVSGVWQLSRRERVVVDLGGMYFTFLGAGGVILAMGIAGWSDVVASLVMVINLHILGCLSPLMRQDGYWFLVDALDIPNLSRAMGEALRQLLRFRKPDIHNRLRRGQRWLFYVYCIAWLAFIPRLIWFGVSRLWAITQIYPHVVHAFLQDALSIDGDLLSWGVGWIRGLLRILMVPMFYLVVGRWIFDWSRSFYRRIRRNVTHDSAIA